MSRDVMGLLEDATPETVRAVDYEQLVRRGRRRRRGRRAAAVLGVAGIVVAAAVVVDVPGGVPVPDVLDRPGDLLTGGGEPEPERMDPEGGPAHVGTWELAADLGGVPRVEPFVGLLGDGRVVVFGGMDRGIEGRRARLDGAVVDPASGEVRALPDAPLPPGWVSTVALAGDRLAVVAETGTAVLDVDAGTWTRLPDRPAGISHPSVVAWDGRTLLAGAVPRPEDGAGEGSPAFALYRWDTGDTGWQPAPEAPLRPGAVTAVEQAFDGRRLALFSSGDGPGQRAAVYDVRTDRWQVIPDRLLPATDRATLAWIDAGLAVVPLQPRPATVSYPREDAPEQVADPVVVDVDAGTGRPLPPVPAEVRDDHFEVAVSGAGRVTADADAVVLVTDTSHTALLPTASVLLDDGSWSPPIAARTISVRGPTVVATTVADAFPNLAPLEAAVLTADGWAPATDSELDNRSGAGVLLDADGLLVVGGWSVRPPGGGEEPDARPSEDDEPGPYVIDLHGSVHRLRLAD